MVRAEMERFCVILYAQMSVRKMGWFWYWIITLHFKTSFIHDLVRREPFIYVFWAFWELFVLEPCFSKLGTGINLPRWKLRLFKSHFSWRKSVVMMWTCCGASMQEFGRRKSGFNETQFNWTFVPWYWELDEIELGCVSEKVLQHFWNDLSKSVLQYCLDIPSS